MELIISNITIEVIKKDIKNMHLSVHPPNGKVRLSVPKNLSDQSIAMFIRTKIIWIKKQQEIFEIQSRVSKREYVSGESLYVWGKQYYLIVDYSEKSNSLVLTGNTAFLTVRQVSTTIQREKFVTEWYRELLKAEILLKLPLWENVTALYSNSWQTKNMITKWGVCNTATKKIWINLQLAKKPIECLDYVILHELTHLKFNNHNKEFIAVLDEFMPNWVEVKKILNDSKLDFMD